MSHELPPKPGRAFERVYSVVVVMKGFNGLLELIAGLVLLIAPSVAGDLLAVAAVELAEGTSPLRAAAARSLAAASSGAAAAAVPIAAFLLVHGVVKLLTVYCLLRRALRGYPWALGALVLLLALQIADLVTSPTVGAVLLTVLDVLVIGLVAWEYHRLRRRVIMRSDDVAVVVAADAPAPIR